MKDQKQDRAVVIFRHEHRFSPSVKLFFQGSEVPSLLNELATLIGSDEVSAPYACARFIGLCHNKLGDRPLGIEVKNTDMRAMELGELEYISIGGAGVVVVDCLDFTWSAYEGYLAEHEQCKKAHYPSTEEAWKEVVMSWIRHKPSIEESEHVKNEADPIQSDDIPNYPDEM